MEFNVENCRSKFPALSSTTKPINSTSTDTSTAPQKVFLDNAGGSQCLGTVIDEISSYLTSSNVQLGASYNVGKDATGRYNAGYTAAAQYINATTSEIVLGPSTTQLYRNLSWSLSWEAGDEIIISKLNHEANIAPWVDVAERMGLKIIWWEPEKGDTNPRLDPKKLEGLLSDKTRFVAVPHVSNVLGTLHDVKSLSRVVREKASRALICVDGVAYAPHGRIDVKDLGVDFYAFSWYKVYGPHIAMLYASPNALKQMKSLGHYFKPSETLEDKLGLAGASYELVAALPKVVKYLGGSDLDSFFEPSAVHEEKLQKVLLDYLSSRADVTIFGEPSPDRKLRVPTISFLVKGWKPQALVEAVEGRAARDGPQLCFRWGAFYANRLCGRLLEDKAAGVVRVSMVHYNTEDEVKGLVDALRQVLDKPKS